MDRSAYEGRQEHWRRVVAECNSSGICKTAWCRQNGVSIKSFYYWQRKFRDEPTVARDSSSLPATACKETGACLSGTNTRAIFVDMTEKLYTPQNSQDEFTPVRSPEPFPPELVIHANGLQVYVCGNIQARTLETVMKVVSHA